MHEENDVQRVGWRPCRELPGSYRTTPMRTKGPNRAMPGRNLAAYFGAIFRPCSMPCVAAWMGIQTSKLVHYAARDGGDWGSVGPTNTLSTLEATRSSCDVECTLWSFDRRLRIHPEPSASVDQSDKKVDRCAFVMTASMHSRPSRYPVTATTQSRFVV
jgi:hypothetical protein